MIAAATSMVPATITGPSDSGRMWRRPGAAGAQRPRRLDELFSRRRQELRPHQPRHRHPAEAADDHATIMMKMPVSGRPAPSAVAEQVDQQQQQRQLRQATGNRSVSHISSQSTGRAPCRRWRRSRRRRRWPSASPRSRPRARCARRTACARQQVLPRSSVPSGCAADGPAARRKSMSSIGTARPAGRPARQRISSPSTRRPASASRWRPEAPPGLALARPLAVAGGPDAAPQPRSVEADAGSSQP